MPGMTLRIDKDSEQHKRLLAMLTSRISLAEKHRSSQLKKWQKADEQVLAYTPTSTDDTVRTNRRENYGEPQYTTLILPYTYAMLMAAHTYWTSVFFARSPVHQFTGRHGEPEMSIQAIEAIVDYQVKVGLMLAPYYLWLYDAGKYGIGILGTYWDEEIKHYTTLHMEGEKAYYVTQRVEGYHGNKNYNVAPWDFMPDPRVPANQFQRGEFCIVRRKMAWNELVRRREQRYYMNVDHIKHSAMWKDDFQSRGTDDERPADISFLEGIEEKHKHPAWVAIYEMYLELIPNEWKLGSSAMPEKWVFTITGDQAVIIGAQPLGAAHCRYPFDVLEPEPEAYALYNRGIPEIISPIQNTMDWLVNSHFYNVRALANGRFVADPSKIDLTQLEDGTPGWIAALRPEAWGTITDIKQVFQQIQTSDPTANHLNDMGAMYQFGERATGINDQMLGALGGGRKTATEVRTTTGFGVNRLKTATEFMSATGFAPHSSMIVQNTQQYLNAEMEVMIAGDLLNFSPKRTIRVDKRQIAGQYDFVTVDGTLPVDRFAQATLWKDILAQIQRMPQIMATYDLGKIFGWMATLAGLKNINQFKIQVGDPAALARQAEAGNIIPFQPGGAPPQTNSAQVPANPMPMG